MEHKPFALEEKDLQRIMLEIRKTIKHIGYGEIVITIHDSRVVQIEKREKKRFT
jgi:hypothetical protein